MIARGFSVRCIHLVVQIFCGWMFTATVTANEQADETLPLVPSGFQVSVFAKEPLVRNPCAMAFDTRGRLFVGQGPQYRHPKPDSPVDRVTLLEDSDGDGQADKARTFAEGFNNIQGLAWFGDQLWIANAPDLTVVRDLDGDDQADEYRRVFGGLGNLEHGLHGLVFAPDGRLYMSKGNSKGYLKHDSPEKSVAPPAFAELWGAAPAEQSSATAGTTVFTRHTYQHGYHHPSDDWGNEGGVLRCRPDGSDLEIYSRGMRNMWDLNFDDNFNWVGTDQDQDGGDRILNPFLGAHFGWGHAWSPHWTGANHIPTVPISGPVFQGSGTGVVFGAASSFPSEFQDVFFCADWLNRSIFAYRPKWHGGQLKNMNAPKVFAKAPQGRSMSSSQGMVFEPTDIEFGPDGALWVLSWGHGYGAKIEDGEQVDKGRVYRISYGTPQSDHRLAKYDKPVSTWTLAELTHDLRQTALPARRTNVQTELLRRGAAARVFIEHRLQQSGLSDGQFTWLAWTLAQFEATTDLESLLSGVDGMPGIDRRIQLLRISGYRAARFGEALPDSISAALNDSHPRMRFAAIQAIQTAKSRPHAADLWQILAQESDRLCFYAAFQAVGSIQSDQELRGRLASPKPGIRKAALLSLLERAALSGDDVVPLRLDPDQEIASIASSFVSKVGTSEAPVLSIHLAVENQAGKVSLKTGNVPDGLHVRYTVNGADPTDTTGIKYSHPFEIEENTTVTAALFRARERMGPVIRRRYSSRAGTSGESAKSESVFPIKVNNVQVVNGHKYRVAQLVVGARVYGNRSYRWTDVPDGFEGHTVLQTLNGDEDVGSTGNDFLRFNIEEPADVFVAHDQRVRQKPDWLLRFEKTNQTITSNDAVFDLYRRSFPKGEVRLGGNTQSGELRCGQYACIVKPVPLTNPKTPTSIDAALSKLESADAYRGARLYHHQSACSKCHRLGDSGNAFAPNLSTFGIRATPKVIAESILKPSAVIMEGFHTVTVVTNSGRSISGFIRQQSGLNLELVQKDGTVINVPQASIEERGRQSISVMPEGYGKQLTAQQVADLICFIVAEGKNRQLAKAQGPNNATVDSVPTGPITIRQDETSLHFHHGTREIATYVFKDENVLRPFFANVKTPNGLQVTRTFPPVKGVDRTDHATMHPGIWIAFGDISGEDFWRNKGRVVSEQINPEPSDRADVARFVEIKSYRRMDGTEICRERFQCALRLTEDGYLVEWDSIFSPADNQEFYFGDQEEMGLGIRVATPIAELKSGRITDSQGRISAAKIWSHAADWIDYSGTDNGRQLGMTILCHPENFRPSWMHARNYGVIAANVFGRKAMEKGDTSKVEVKAGETLRLRYGILLHDKPARTLNQAYHAYLKNADSD